MTKDLEKIAEELEKITNGFDTKKLEKISQHLPYRVVLTEAITPYLIRNKKGGIKRPGLISKENKTISVEYYNGEIRFSHAIIGDQPLELVGRVGGGRGCHAYRPYIYELREPKYVDNGWLEKIKSKKL